MSAWWMKRSFVGLETALTFVWLEHDHAERNMFKLVNHAIKHEGRAFTACTVRLKML
jgi:hypothetical protein